MSVIIKGFDKPSDCDYCTLQDDSYCNVLLSYINVEHGIDTRCPMVEIKDMTDEEFDSMLVRLLADRKTENLSEFPTRSDEPQRDCFLCKWLGEVNVCGRCRNRNLFAEADTEPKPKDEPQTEYPRCAINGTPFDECGFCEHFNCDTCKCEAQTERRE